MRRRNQFLSALTATLALSAPALADISLEPIGRYETGVFADGASEISAYDPGTQRLFVTNGSTGELDVLDLSDPTSPAFLFSIDLAPYGAGANSVSVHGGIVAAAVQANTKTDLGQAVFFDTDGNYLNAVTVGALPDMITITPNGRYALVANEGEPDDDYVIDPEGSVSVIDLSCGVVNLNQSYVRTADFRRFNNRRLNRSVRIFGPNATVAQDLEPEFITVSSNSRWAWVTLQENNALGVIHIPTARVTAVKGLGFKNHQRHGNGFDASNEDGAINIQSWPVRGMYQPDSIASYRRWGLTFLVTANEGDARDYAGFSEETRIGDLVLDPTRFPNAAMLQDDANLGRLKTTTTLGDTDGDGDVDRLYAYGARSFSIRLGNGALVYDSGDELEQLTALAHPDNFNSDDEENGSFDDRSDDKGPEPEGVTIGKVDGRYYAFVGLERIGGIATYDIHNPFDPFLVDYINTRDFAGDPVAGTAGDMSPEGLVFIPGADSPTGEPLLVVSYEVSGSTSVYRININP